MNDDFDMPSVPAFLPDFALPAAAPAPAEPQELTQQVHEEPKEVGIEEFLQAQQAKPPAMPVQEILDRSTLESVLNDLALRIEEDAHKTLNDLQETTLALNEAAQAQIDAAVALAKADVRGVAVEVVEDVAERAGAIVVSVLCEEVARLTETIEANTKTMLETAGKMQKAAQQLPSAPSRFVWLVTGAVGFWWVTNHIDLTRWAAIGSAVGKSIQGVL